MAKKKSVNPAKNAALSDSENKAVKVDELGNKVSEAPVHVSEINVDDYSVEERWKLPRKLWNTGNVESRKHCSHSSWSKEHHTED